MKRSLGQNCYLLLLKPTAVPRNESAFRKEAIADLIELHSSTSRIQPDSPVGLFISDDDISSVKKLVKEMIQYTIIPFMEKSVHFWNEQVL